MNELQEDAVPLFDLTEVQAKNYEKEIRQGLKRGGYTEKRHQKFQCKFKDKCCIFHPNGICSFRVEQQSKKMKFIHYSTESVIHALANTWTPRCSQSRSENGFYALNKQITKDLKIIIDE